MGFPVIFLKHVVPSLNVLLVLLSIIKTEKKKPLLPSNRRASCSRTGGQVKICKVHLFIFTACLLDNPEGREAGETANFTQLQCFFIEILSIHSV